MVWSLGFRVEAAFSGSEPQRCRVSTVTLMRTRIQWCCKVAGFLGFFFFWGGGGGGVEDVSGFGGHRPSWDYRRIGHMLVYFAPEVLEDYRGSCDELSNAWFYVSASAQKDWV